ncbi:hypothetical protein SprV_0802507500 [Sparganum proliferum]
MSRTPVHPTAVPSEVQGLLDRIFQSTGPSEFKLPSSPSFTTRDLPSTSRSVATMVAAGTPPAPPSDVPVTHAPIPYPMVEYTYNPGPSPLLAPEPYVPENNIHDWLRDLDVFLVTVPIYQRTCYLIRFLSTPARKRVFDAGINHTTPFDVARRTVIQLFHTPASTGMAAERFAALRQARDQSVDDFANQLSHLALLAFPNLPPPDRDTLILYRFISGLSDPNATDILLLHPPPSLSDAIQRCRLYTAHHQERRINPAPPAVTPRPESGPPARKSRLPVRLPQEYLRLIEPSPKNRNLRAANGTGIPISGSITLQFVVNDSTLTYHFLVTPVSPWPIVLGLDFLTDNDCTIYTRHRRLVIGSPTSPKVSPTPSDEFDLVYNAVLSAAALDPTRLNDVLPTLSTVGPVAHKQLSDLLASFSDLFSWSTDTLGRTRLVQHTIDTGDAKPIWQPPRRIPVRYRDEVDKLLDELLQAKIIQPSSSPRASPIALVPKKDGSLRLCVDYRRLNAVTVRDSFPLPRLDDTIDALGQAAWFSILDLKSGYWQVEIHPNDRHKTTFTVPQGLFEFQTLPFGLCNAAATFQRLMYRVLRHLIPYKCLVYLDDIIVFGRSTEEHNSNLREVLEALQEAGLTLNPTKCLFLRSEVQFLGHLISPGRISPLPDRVKHIRTWPTPTNQTELRSFLGLASYYRRFIRNFAQIAAPLHKLTEKGRPYTWSADCDTAFNNLRAALCSAPLLALPNVDDDAPPFILDTDASGFAIGAVLSQIGKDGVEHPICFASNTLTKTQRNYCTFRRELLAIVMFIRQFKHLLVGRRFILRTDHRALQWLRSIKDPMDQLARWQEFLQDFDFECQFRPGHKHGNADALSRLPNSTNPADESHDTAANAIIVAEPTRYAWSSAQSSDPDTAVIYHHLSQGLSKPSEQAMRGTSQNARLLLNQWPHLVVLHDILFFRDPSSHQLRPVVPGCLVDTVLADLHSQLGHCGQRRTELAARTRFWWPQLRTSVAHFCQSCATCASFKTPNPAPRAPMQPMTTGFPGERVGLDIIGPLPISVRGYEYILVMVDYFTKWVEATPLLRQDATSVANAITRTWISRWGAPLAFHSDCGSNFDSQLFKDVCDTLRIHKTRTTPYHPEGNSLVERTNRTLHNLLLAFSKDNHEHDWDVHLPFCLLAYRGSVHSSTGFTPHYLWTGRDIRLPIDLLYPLPTPDTTTPQDYATRLREVIRSAHNAARTTLGSSSLHQKEQHDRHSSGVMHQIGDLVMYYNPSHPRGTSAKFHYPWQGPFVV